MARFGANKGLNRESFVTTGQFHILVVEDDPYDTLLILQALGDHKSYKVRAVESGVEAIAFLCGQFPFSEVPLPHLIFLDLKLPSLDGHALLAEIKSDERLSHIPVVVLSNSDFDMDIHRSYALHANAYVQKPLNPVQFRQAIQRVMDFWLNTATLPYR
jgi:CheY-like chemotaxis protein